MPEFPNGGMAGLMQYLSKNIKYPTIAQENGTQGRVTVQFVVNKDGSIANAKVLRGVDPELDKEAVRVVSVMPKWKPGTQKGEAVRVKYTVPVMFRLTEDNTQVKYAPIENKISQREIADKMNIKPQGLTKILNKKNFGFEDAERILSAMGYNLIVDFQSNPKV